MTRMTGEQFDRSAVVTDPTLTIDGVPVVGSGRICVVEDPATEQVIAEFPQAGLDQVELAVHSARRAFRTWSRTSPGTRADLIDRLADEMADAAGLLLATLIREVGTPVTLATNLQVNSAVSSLRWYAEAARRSRDVDLGVTTIGAPRHSWIRARPAGVVAAISAYNYPLLLAMAKIGGALAAGCPVVLLPSPLAPLAVLELGRLAVRAGFPPGVLNVVAGGPDVGQALTGHPEIDVVSFTGSAAVGAQILSQTAPGIKRAVLELGGKSGALVLPSADLDLAARTIHHRYGRNAGQGCASPTRIFVHRSELAAFVDASEPVYRELVVGDPWSPETVVGPVISRAHRDRIEGAVSAALARGGRQALLGNHHDTDRGWWVRPQLLVGLDNTDPVARQELFGPVAVLLPYDGVDEAVDLVNDSEYGLAAYVFGDPERAEEIAAELRVGTVSINEAGGSRSGAPSGGLRRSGLGREGGEWGIAEFLEPQHVQRPADPANRSEEAR